MLILEKRRISCNCIICVVKTEKWHKGKEFVIKLPFWSNLCLTNLDELGKKKIQFLSRKERRTFEFAHGHEADNSCGTIHVT